MCNPDLTVEVKDEEIGGVTGFGTTHSCQSWEDLLNWTSRWEGWNRTAKEQQDREKHIHETNHGGHD